MLFLTLSFENPKIVGAIMKFSCAVSHRMVPLCVRQPDDEAEGQVVLPALQHRHEEEEIVFFATTSLHANQQPHFLREQLMLNSSFSKWNNCFQNAIEFYLNLVKRIFNVEKVKKLSLLFKLFLHANAMDVSSNSRRVQWHLEYIVHYVVTKILTFLRKRWISSYGILLCNFLIFLSTVISLWETVPVNVYFILAVWVSTVRIVSRGFARL